MKIKLLKIHTLYDEYLRLIQPEVDLISDYKSKLNYIMEDGYYWGESLSFYLKDEGYECYDVVRDCDFLQLSWNKENNKNLKDFEFEFEQIRLIKPDVVFLTNLRHTVDEIKRIRQLGVRCVVGWHCAPINQALLKVIKKLDGVATCTKGFSEIYKKHEIAHLLMHYGADSRWIVKDRISFEERQDLVFSGSFVIGHGYHYFRLKSIFRLIKNNLNLKVYSHQQSNSLRVTVKYYILKIIYLIVSLFRFNGLFKRLFESYEMIKILRIIERKFNKPVYGNKMHQLLANSKIAINFQTNSIDQYSGNLRMFEITSMGSLLLTDRKKDIENFFVNNEEMVVFESEEDCINKIKWLLNNPEILKSISQKGQARCLKDHHISIRAKIFSNWIKSLLDKST